MSIVRNSTIGNISTTTTYHSVTWPPPPSSTTTDPEESFNEVLTIGIPLVVIFIVLLTLCMVLLYSKARRRRAASRGQRDPMTAISGGVAMNANAYLGYPARLHGQNYRNSGSQPSQPANTGAATGCPVHSPYIMDSPPTYEDAMKEVNTSYNSGIVNMSFGGSSDLINEPPPSYEPSVDSGSHQAIEPASTQIDSSHGNTVANPSEPSEITTSANTTILPVQHADIQIAPSCSSEQLQQTSDNVVPQSDCHGDISHGSSVDASNHGDHDTPSTDYSTTTAVAVTMDDNA